MMENIFVGAMILIAVVVGIWCWWHENHGTDIQQPTTTSETESQHKNI